MPTKADVCRALTGIMQCRDNPDALRIRAAVLLLEILDGRVDWRSVMSLYRRRERLA